MPCATCGRWTEHQWIQWHSAPANRFPPPEVWYVSTNRRWVEQNETNSLTDMIAWFFCEQCIAARIELERARQLNGLDTYLIRILGNQYIPRQPTQLQRECQHNGSECVWPPTNQEYVCGSCNMYVAARENHQLGS